jgi:hypothetical protein
MIGIVHNSDSPCKNHNRYCLLYRFIRPYIIIVDILYIIYIIIHYLDIGQNPDEWDVVINIFSVTANSSCHGNVTLSGLPPYVTVTVTCLVTVACDCV